ncbi:YraN family protein [Ralstonia mannitolilytica]
MPLTAATGDAGEDRALRYLQARGLSVVTRNYRCKAGEIDLVMRDAAGALVFVEVRARVARSTQRFGGAAASVTPAKQRRLIAAAEDFLAQQAQDVPACRFDVIAIDGTRIEWMRDAFGVEA